MLKFKDFIDEEIEEGKVDKNNNLLKIVYESYISIKKQILIYLQINLNIHDTIQ